MATPNITLTATLLDYSGNIIGSTAAPAWLRIALCNFGPTLPVVPGTGNITKVTSWFVDVPFTGAQVTVALWANDQITPSGTYYAISVLDTQKNVLETGVYQFTGGVQTIDLSNAPQIVPGEPVGLLQLAVKPCTGTVPGTVYTAPGTIVALLYNGVILYSNLSAPTLSFTLTGSTVATLNFTTEMGDLIYALCLVS